jgi:hypothetical protein
MTVVFDNINLTPIGANAIRADFASFTSTVTGNLSFLQLRLSGLIEPGTNTFDIGLYANNPNNTPGPIIALLETVVDNSLPPSDNIYTVNLASNPAVLTGTRYWIGLTSSNSESGWVFTLTATGTGVVGEFRSSNGFTVPNTQGSPFQMLVIISQSIPCLHPRTLVSTPTGQRFISSLKQGDSVLDVNNKPVRLRFNMEFGKTGDFVLIKKGALGPESKSQLSVNAQNFPNNDLLIRKNHPILINGKEINPADLIKNVKGVRHKKLASATPTWSLCTEERTFVMMEGVPVATWAYESVKAPTFKYDYIKH